MDGIARALVGTTFPPMQKVRIEVWSDIACPWCWVGKRHLEEALDGFPHDVEVIWRAFELDPSAPRERDDADLVQRLARKYGTSRAGAQQMIDRMTRVGKENGLDFRFDRVKPGNTFDAHRLVHWAATQGRQDAMKERLFVAYMQEGQSVGDHDVLVALATDVGLDEERARAVLAANDYADDVRAEELAAREIGVTGVPFFVIGGQYAVPGAQPAAVLREAMERSLDLADVTVPEDASLCGPDGCAVP